ncbi:hypothetical protein CEXT_267171 [Caerostris extrusa]|uniref:Uncharacterized protein n=1 Tax=Caerostris extrusa TaxID=172846 RepID=A0AAV4WEY3_CAEEX|nr:hypothetical protein CEXT_267171 [Caerostris extrusa]
MGFGDSFSFRVASEECRRRRIWIFWCLSKFVCVGFFCRKKILKAEEKNKVMSQPLNVDKGKSFACNSSLLCSISSDRKCGLYQHPQYEGKNGFIHIENGIRKTIIGDVVDCPCVIWKIVGRLTPDNLIVDVRMLLLAVRNQRVFSFQKAETAKDTAEFLF